MQTHKQVDVFYYKVSYVILIILMLLLFGQTTTSMSNLFLLFGCCLSGYGSLTNICEGINSGCGFWRILVSAILMFVGGLGGLFFTFYAPLVYADLYPIYIWLPIMLVGLFSSIALGVISITMSVSKSKNLDPSSAIKG